MILVLQTSCWSQTWSPGWSTIDRTVRMAAGRVPSDKKEPEVSMSGWVFYCASEKSGDIRVALRLNVGMSRKGRFWGLDVGILVPVAAGARRCKKKHWTSSATISSRKAHPTRKKRARTSKEIRLPYFFPRKTAPRSLCRGPTSDLSTVLQALGDAGCRRAQRLPVVMGSP